MYGGAELTDDELLARRLQEEEERSISSQTPMNDMSQLSVQEREDMMLARQMQEMDSFGPGVHHRGNSTGSHSRSMGGPIPYAQSNSAEDRLAYARRLQEQAFQRVRDTSPVRPVQSREEADRELAMKMQIEEGEAVSTDPDQEDEDMKLARFMEESGVSVRELDEDALEAVKKGETASLTSQLARGPPVGGLGGPSALGLGRGGGGGMLGGMYGNRRDDSSDEEDSIDMSHQGTSRPAIPSAIPPVSRIPSSIPGIPSPSHSLSASGRHSPGPQSHAPSDIHQASIPGGIPPPTGPIPGNRKPAPTSPQVAAVELPGGRQASIRLGGGGDFQRQLPKASKSSGPGTQRTGMSTRMLPSPSKSFGVGSRATGSRRDQAQSTSNLMAMRSQARSDRSKSPTRRQRGRKGQAEAPIEPIMGDLPPGVNMGNANDPMAFGQGSPEAAAAPSSAPAKKKKGGKLLSRIFRGNKHSDKNVNPHDIPDAIPAAIPGPGEGAFAAGPLPHSVTASRNINRDSLRSSLTSQPQTPHERRQATPCSVCGGLKGKMLVAVEKRFHVECFRCMSCNEIIDPSSVFAVSIDPMGEQQPLHRKCYAEFYGVQCAVCKKAIPANEDGSVSFIKHPFFNTEQMCPIHAEEPNRRRCTGCHRFEPEDEPFADLDDGDRCACYACCRTVIMNNMDVKPLWSEVLRYLEFGLGLPIWEEMREIPILIVDQTALNESQLKDGTSVHGDSSQIMTRGLCLSEHENNSMSFRVPSQRFNESLSNFEACNHSGFMELNVGPLRGNAHSEVMAILCLSGLPRDLTASVLAHEATHAWIKLHPDFKVRNSLPAQVEEGCAQLVAYLFLCDGLEEPRRSSGTGPSDEKLRQYFKFSIETDDDDIYGEGYRRAALAYSTIGIAALLNHVVHYQEFPPC